MSDPVKNMLAASVAEKPLQDHGAGRRQQWRLIFEKAYLALSRNESAGTRVQAERAALAGTGGSPNPNEWLFAKAGEGKAATFNNAGYAATAYGFGADAADLAVDLATGRFEQRIMELLNGSGALLPLNTKTSNATAASAAREAGQAGGHKNAVPDKSLMLLPSEQGLQLIIRDAAISAELVNRIILKVRDILGSRGMRLVRVIVNGAELWKENTDPGSGKSAETSDSINKIY